jgi:hypothetical protein
VYVVGVNPVLRVAPELDLIVVYMPVIVFPERSADLTVNTGLATTVVDVSKYAVIVVAWLNVIVLVLAVDPLFQWSKVESS